MIQPVLKSVRWAKFRFRLAPTEPLFLPEYKGSAFRGGFGHVFRKVACVASALGSRDCPLNERCPYHYIFETPPPAGSQVLTKVPTAPQPFVIEPPLEAKRVYEPGEALTFHLVLVGRAIDYLPYFIYAFDELGRVGLGRGKGKYRLISVESLSLMGEVAPLYSGAKKLLQSNFEVMRADDLLDPCPALPPNGEVTIHFLTSTRIKSAGHLTDEAEFQVLFRSLHRRIALLSYFHCGGAWEDDVGALLEQAKGVVTEASTLRWQDWERYSNRQQTRMALGGFVGQVTYQGMLPWGYTAHSKARGQEEAERPTIPGYRARRWVVERTHSWFNRFRRRLIRWEKKGANYLAFVHFAWAWVTFRAAGVLG